MAPQTLPEWLAHAECQHTVGIDLGLERIARVAAAMGFAAPDYRAAPLSVIVAGTNGKGSTTVFTEALLRAAGLRVGATLSPHVHLFNERVRLDGHPVDDAVLCRAFAAVESARGATTLTYFEYSALVALSVFREAKVDAAVLEVGLGGRLDAFNLVGADVAVVTSIGLDHEAFLGSDLERIGQEKAGVMRPGRCAVIGADVTASVRREAQRLGCPLRIMGESFAFTEEPDCWHFEGAAGRFRDLPWGFLAPYNCALAIAAAGCLVPVTETMIQTALATARLPGRCEAWSVDGRLVVVDVAHNPAGAAFLRRLLQARYPGRRFVALAGMLVDKNAGGVADALGPLIARWVCVPTRGARGQAAASLAAQIRPVLPAGVRDASIAVVEDVAAGFKGAMAAASPGDGILALGSFDLVENLRNLLSEGRLPPARDASLVRGQPAPGSARRG